MPATKVPKTAKRVFKGVIFDVYHWQQKMFRGPSKTFEIIKRQDTVVVLATVKDKIVVIKEQQPSMDWYYSTPAGRMDVPGETPKQTAARELLEEAGLKTKKMTLWKVEQINGKVIHNVYHFVARDCYKVADQTLDAGEKIEVKLLTYDQFLALAKGDRYYRSDFMIDMLQALVDKQAYRKLKKVIFG